MLSVLFDVLAEFYERSPHRNHVEGQGACNVTRFLAVAAVNNEAKHKVCVRPIFEIKTPEFHPTSRLQWLYAFNIIPASRMDPNVLLQAPIGTTASPYLKDVPKAAPVAEVLTSFHLVRK